MPGLERRNNAPPCPDADGTTIGSQLQFLLSCGHDIDGSVIDTLDAQSLAECAEFCANTHPRCNAFTFSDRNSCRMISNMDGGPKRSFFRDAGVAQYPVLAASSCSNGGPQAIGGGQFTMNCNMVVNGADLAQRHKATLNDCAEDCAVTQGCAAFSFNANLDLGFMNCYLKTSIPDGAMGTLQGVDTGVLNAAVPGFNTIGSGGGDTGGILFTPSRGVATRTLVQVSTSASSVISITQLVTVPADSTPTGFAQTGRTSDDSDDGNGANMAWVAAPVVGGIAAVLVVVVMFIMFRKKKQRRNGSDGGSTDGGMMGFMSKKRMPDFSGSGGMLGFWKPNNAGAERLGSSGDEKPMSRYMVKDGKSVPRPGSEPHRPMTGLFRSKE